jgi:hypothetical protein
MGQVKVESIRGVLIRNRYLDGKDNSLRIKVGLFDRARLVLRLQGVEAPRPQGCQRQDFHVRRVKWTRLITTTHMKLHLPLSPSV